MAAGELDVEGLHKYKDKAVNANTKGVEYLFKKGAITLVAGRGRLAGPGKIEVTSSEGAKKTIATKSTIVATGTVIRTLPGVEFDGQQIINSDHALQFKKVPASMIVLGAGAVGVEFASIFA